MSADPRWGAVLDSLEADIAAAMSAEAPASWSPPSDLGEMPEELRERARLIADAQTEAVVIIEHGQSDRARHLQAIDTVPSAGENMRPASLNVIG